MLTEFEVRNFRSITSLDIDFRGSKNYKFNKECLNGDILGKIVIMGENGVGKTNLAQALMQLIDTAFNNDCCIEPKDDPCFINAFSNLDSAVFRYVFSFNGIEVVYEFAKSSPSKMVSERLTVNKSVMFECDHRNGTCALDGVTAKNIVCDGTSSVLSQLLKMKQTKDAPMIHRVGDFARNMLYFKSSGKSCDHHICHSKSLPNIEAYIIKSKCTDDLMHFLGRVSSVDFSMESDGSRLYMVKNGKRLPMMEAASRGTMMLMRLFCWFRQAKTDGSLLIFDDFDCMFHFETSISVLRYLISETRAQCVFVTNNASLFSNDIMRPDCCFIMTKDSIKSVSSLTDKRLRKGHNIEKLVKCGSLAQNTDE